MAIVFAWRATDGFVARYSNGGSLGVTAGATSIQTAADVSAIGGQCVTTAQNNNIKYISWPGRGNVPANSTVAILARIAPGYSGTPSAARSIFTLGASSSRGTHFELVHSGTSATMTLFARNDTVGACFGNNAGMGIGNYSATSASYTDYYCQWIGTTGASAAATYINGTIFGVYNSTGAMINGWFNKINEILIGGGFQNGIVSNDRLSELVIWDQTIDVTSVQLADGTTASLNGPSRTAFVDVVALDGQAWTTLAQTNVRNTIVYTAAGVVFTGSVTTAAAVVGGSAGAPSLGWPTFS